MISPQNNNEMASLNQNWNVGTPATRAVTVSENRYRRMAPPCLTLPGNPIQTFKTELQFDNLSVCQSSPIPGSTFPFHFNHSTSSPQNYSATISLSSTPASHNYNAAVPLSSTPAPHNYNASVPLSSTPASHNYNASVPLPSTPAPHNYNATAPLSSTPAPHNYNAAVPLSSTPAPCYNHPTYPSYRGDNCGRTAAMERLLTKFPELLEMLEEEEKAILQQGTSFQPVACSTPSFYEGLHLPYVNFTPNIASSVMDEEHDIGYNSLSEAYSTPSLSTDELDSLLNSTFALTENDPLEVKNQTTLQTAVSIHCHDDLMTHVKPELHEQSTERQRYPCTLCPKSYVTRSNLAVHMRGHRGERPHTCDHCGKGFAQKSALRTHIRTHTGERPYKCAICPKAFSDFSTYTKHNRTHTGERPYTCDICGKGFAQSGNMIRHRQIHQRNELLNARPTFVFPS